MPRAIVEPRGNAAAGGRVEREADDLTPSGSRQLSQWELAALPVGVSKIPLGIPLGAFGGASGSFKKRLEKRVGAQGVRLAHPTGTLAFGEAPSPGPTRRREAHPACTHWEAAPLLDARHFLCGTFLLHILHTYAASFCYALLSN